MAEEDRSRVGTVLHDKWTLERLIGAGGMGAVYAARHRNGAKAAVKIFSPHNANPQLRDRFLREGYAANKVEHSGAVKVLDDDVIDKGPDEGLAYLVMELLEGESLFDRSNRAPALTERDLLELADAILAVLESAHANGVVHRDLKPENLFLAKNPDRPERVEIKVLDFGLARLLERAEQSWNGMAFGTPMFMSPEQAAGKIADIDGRTDIYALGAILFQLSSKKPIHEAMHTLGLVVRTATAPAPKLRDVAPEVSPPFASVVDKALAFDRADRFRDASAMRAAIRDALAALPPQPTSLNLEPAPSFATRATVLAEAEGPPSFRTFEAANPAPALTVPSAPRALAAANVDDAATADASTAAPPKDAPAEERATRVEPAVQRAAASRSRVFSPGVLLLAAVAVGGFVAYDHRASLFGTGAPPAVSSEEPAASAPLALDAEDAGEDEDDAGEDDAGEDEDDLDASIADAAPDAHSTIARPAAHKRPPRRAPRKPPKKKRWGK